MKRFHFRTGMDVDGLGTFGLDRGRPLLRHFHRVEVLNGDEIEAIEVTETEAHVAAASSETFSPAPEKCMLCERGILVDVEGEKSRQSNPNRLLLCLEGMPAPDVCLFHLRDALSGARRPVMTEQTEEAKSTDASS